MQFERDNYENLTKNGQVQLFKFVTKTALKVVIGIVALVFLFGTFRIIPAGHRGVVLRFGNVDRVMNEGLNFKLPLVEKVWKVETRVTKEEVDASAASSDMQDVNARIALNYHLDNDKVKQLYEELGSEFKSRIIDPNIQEGFKSVVSKYPVTEILVKRMEIKEAAKKQILDRLAVHNILVDDLSIVNISFSAQFTSAIELKQVAQQDAEKAGYKLDASRKEAEAMKIQAEALSQNKELVEWEAVKKWNGVLPTTTGGAIPFLNIGK